MDGLLDPCCGLGRRNRSVINATLQPGPLLLPSGSCTNTQAWQNLKPLLGPSHHHHLLTRLIRTPAWQSAGLERGGGPMRRPQPPSRLARCSAQGAQCLCSHQGHRHQGHRHPHPEDPSGLDVPQPPAPPLPLSSRLKPCFLPQGLHSIFLCQLFPLSLILPLLFGLLFHDFPNTFAAGKGLRERHSFSALLNGGL